MGLLDRLRRSRRAARLLREAEALLEQAEALEDAGAPHDDVAARAGAALRTLEEAEAAGLRDHDHLCLRRAQALLSLRRPDEALAPAHRAARARPYDVDSRLVHARVRLALGQLREAEHEYAAVLEEFAGDPDATRGRRAVMLARGSLPLEEDDRAEDRAAAADLLIAAWRTAGAVDPRLRALREAGADAEVIALLQGAIARRRAGR